MMNRQRGKRGAVLIELALLAPLLIFLVLGAIHFGYLFFLYNDIEKCVRDGARYASTRTYYPARQGDFVAKIQRVTAYGTMGGTTSLVPDLSPSQVSVALLYPNANGRPAKIRVSINGWQYRGVLSFLFGTTTLNGKPSLEVPFIGIGPDW